MPDHKVTAGAANESENADPPPPSLPPRRLVPPPTSRKKPHKVRRVVDAQLAKPLLVHFPCPRNLLCRLTSTPLPYSSLFYQPRHLLGRAGAKGRRWRWAELNSHALRSFDEGGQKKNAAFPHVTHQSEIVNFVRERRANQSESQMRDRGESEIVVCHLHAAAVV